MVPVVKLTTIRIEDTFEVICLFGLGQANSSLAKVVDGVVAAQECVTQDGKRTDRLRNVHSHEGRNAAARHLQDVVIGADGEIVPAEPEGDIREVLALVAVNRVLSVVALLGANLAVQELSKLAREGNERSAGVQDHTGVVELSNLVAKSNGIEVNLPVSLPAQGDLGDLPVDVVLVDTTKDNLGLRLLISEVEGEHRLVNKLLVDHGVEWRDNLIHRQPVETHTEDSVKSAKGKSQARLLSSFGEVKVLDLQVSDGHNIVGNETLHAAGAILDLKLGPVLLVSR